MFRFNVRGLIVDDPPGQPPMVMFVRVQRPGTPPCDLQDGYVQLATGEFDTAEAGQAWVETNWPGVMVLYC